MTSVKGFSCSSRKLLPLNKTGWSEKVLPDISRFWATVHEHGSLSLQECLSPEAPSCSLLFRNTQAAFQPRRLWMPPWMQQKRPQGPSGTAGVSPSIASRCHVKDIRRVHHHQTVAYALPYPPKPVDLKKVGPNGDLPAQGPSGSGPAWCLFPGNTGRDRLPFVGMLKQGLKSPQYRRLRPSSGSDWIASRTPPHSPALALCSAHSSGGPLPVQASGLRG